MNGKVTISYKYSSPSDAQRTIEDAIPSIVGNNDFSSPNWKVRFECFESFCSQILSKELDSEAVVLYFGSIHPTWKESNIQILSKMIETFSACASKEFSPAASVLAIGFFVEKIAEPKLKGQIYNILSCITSNHGFMFLFEQMHSLLSAHKNPKVTAEGIKTLVQLIGFCPVPVLSAKLGILLEFCKKCCGHSNAAVRSETVAFLCKIRNIHGQDIRSLLNAFPSNVLSTIDVEFKKNPLQLPHHEEREEPPINSCKSMEIDSLESQEEPIVIVGIQEITSHLSSADWKKRKNAIDSLLKGIISNSLVVEPDLFPTLREKLSDSNKSIVILALDLFSQMCTISSYRELLDRNSRTLLLDVLNCLSDAKEPVRNAALKCLDGIYTTFGADCILLAVSSSLCSNENPVFRKCLLKWISDNSASLSPVALIASISTCLSDKNLDVRKATQLVITSFGADLIKEKAYKYPNLINFIDNLSSKSATDHQQFSTLSRSQSKSKISIETSSIFLPSCPQTYQKSLNPASLKWNTENYKVDLVKEQLAPFLAPSLVAQLFCLTEFKEVVAGLASVEDAISNVSPSDSFTEQAICCCYDSLLKLVAVKIMDSNSTVLGKSIELCEKILLFLDSHQMNLDEQEAASFLPFVVCRLGDGKEGTKAKLHDLIKHTCRIFPASKVLMIILQEGLKNKNSKTRAESLEACYWLLERNGVNSLIFHPNKVISLLAACLTDASTRSNCLRIFAFIHGNSTDGASMIQKFAYPTLGAKEKDFLDERLKRCSAVPNTSSSASSSASNATSSEKREFEAVCTSTPSKVISSLKKPSGIPTCFKFDFDQVEAELQAKSQHSNSSNSNSNANNNSKSNSFQASSMPNHHHNQTMPMEQNNIEFIIANLTSQDQVKCLDAVNVLYTNVVLGKSECFPVAWFPQLVSILSTLTATLQMIMNMSIFASSSSLPIKVQVLRKIGEIVERCFQSLKANASSNAAIQPELQSIIYELLGQLLLRLVDGSLEAFGAESAEMHRHFNATILSVLEHGPKTPILVVCIRLLRESCLELSPTSANYNQTTAEMASKVANLVLRCLWKLTKAIPSIERAEIDPECVLGEICIFYQHLPSDEWRARASSLGAGVSEVPHGDVPHRTVKAIIVELFRVFGEHLFTFTKTPEMEYIRFQLVALRDDHNSSSRHESTASMPSTPSKDRENPFKIQLTSIFSRLINKSEYPQAIHDLYQFVRKDHIGNPLVETLFNDQLARCSSIFQRHVKSQLEKMAIEESVAASNEMQIDSMPAQGQESYSFGKVDCNSASSNSLDPYQEKLDRFKEILGISTRSSSSQAHSKTTLKIEKQFLPGFINAKPSPQPNNANGTKQH